MEFELDVLMYPKRKAEYEKKLGEFEKELKQYSELITHHRSLLIRESYFDSIKSKCTFRTVTTDSPKGFGEKKFFESLDRYFNGKVYKDARIEELNRGYIPDYVIKFSEINVHFDIEIDEMFSFEKRIPIHYIDSNDELRNLHFYELNWVVIRFSEGQVMKFPNECCRIIEYVYNAIATMQYSTLYSTIVEKFFSIFQQRWTEDDVDIFLTLYNDNLDVGQAFRDMYRK